jgi:hypothetical protein
MMEFKSKNFLFVVEVHHPGFTAITSSNEPCLAKVSTEIRMAQFDEIGVKIMGVEFTNDPHVLNHKNSEQSLLCSKFLWKSTIMPDCMTPGL